MTAASVDRVVVGISGSLGNLAALHAAVAAARRSNVQLIAVNAWIPVGGEITYRRSPCMPLLHEWRQRAEATVADAFIDAFGEPPADLRITSVTVRGDAGPALVGVASRSTDVLVVGAGRRGRLARLKRGSVSRYCLVHARCPVLAVPQPDMINELRARGHSWRKRRTVPPVETARDYRLREGPA